jgi:hypothetical protein
MLKRQKIALVVLAVGTLLASASAVGTAWARGENAPQKSPLVLGTEDVKQLVLLLDQDKNGRVSKAEFMKFMSEEFDRLDKDRSGELDVQELKDSQVRVSHFASVGK